MFAGYAMTIEGGVIHLAMSINCVQSAVNPDNWGRVCVRGSARKAWGSYVAGANKCARRVTARKPRTHSTYEGGFVAAPRIKRGITKNCGSSRTSLSLSLSLVQKSYARRLSENNFSIFHRTDGEGGDACTPREKPSLRVQFQPARYECFSSRRDVTRYIFGIRFEDIQHNRNLSDCPWERSRIA